MSKLKKDSHGFYVRVNGGVYRPEKSVEDYPLATGVRTFITSFKEGEQVNITNMNRTPFCKVSNNKFVKEVWCYHGRSMQGNKLLPSGECWLPV